MRIFTSKVLGLIGLSQFTIPVTSAVIYLPFVLLCLIKHHSKRTNARYLAFLVMAGAVALYFFFTLAIYPHYATYYASSYFGVWDGIFRPDRGAIFGFLAVLVCKDSKRLYNNLVIAAVLIFLSCLYDYIQMQRVGYWEVIDYTGKLFQSEYNLSFGYSIAFCAMMFLSNYFKKKKLWALGLFAVSTFLCISDGPRGAILCILAFLMFYGFKAIQGAPNWKVMLFVILSLLFYIILSYFWEDIVAFILSCFMSANLDSRTVSMLLNGTISNDSGRQIIQVIVQSHIKDMPLLGFGAFGERQFVAPYFSWGYSHNLFLEIIVDFGWVIGSVVIAILMLRLLNALRRSSDYAAIILCALLGICSKLMLSDSFWLNKLFWSLIAYVFILLPKEINMKSRHFQLKSN